MGQVWGIQVAKEKLRDRFDHDFAMHPLLGQINLPFLATVTFYSCFVNFYYFIATTNSLTLNLPHHLNIDLPCPWVNDEKVAVSSNQENGEGREEYRGALDTSG